MPFRRHLAWILPCCFAMVLGCAAEPQDSPAPDASAQDAAASRPRTLPIPGAQAPAPQQTRQPLLGPSPKATAGNRLVWTVPADWIPETPRNSVRLEQYAVPGSGGNGQMVVFYFGPGQGGDAFSNAFRWAGQFTQPDGSPSAERVDLQSLEGPDWPTQWMEMTGDYNGGMGDDPIGDAMLLAGIVQGPDAPWFFKIVGPRSTLSERKEEFLTLLRSVRRAS